MMEMVHGVKLGRSAKEGRNQGSLLAGEISLD